MQADPPVIELRGVHKRYSLETRPWHRLWQQLSGGHAGPVHHALHDINLSVRRGEVVGVLGRNGAGKSTLLQVVCGVLQPSAGERVVRGRIAALLELGAGFNPELTGRENVRLNGPLLGLTPAQVEARLPSIEAFAEIGEFIDQPVRSYSSGMFVRLAFAMATSVEPEILIVDEALSVGDDVFARKSFARIMELKESGVTILFCSHVMFQIEALCSRAVWIHEGRIVFDGAAPQAVVEYRAWIDRAEGGGASQPKRLRTMRAELQSVTLAAPSRLVSGRDDFVLDIAFHADPALPPPTLAVALHGADGRTITASGSFIAGVPVPRSAAGQSRMRVVFPALSLLKGHYTASVFVMCERAIDVLAAAEHVLAFEMEQDHLEQGVVSLPHRWEALP
jgi:lipopolysaccharide transport system ATP-binding protein